MEVTKRYMRVLIQQGFTDKDLAGYFSLPLEHIIKCRTEWELTPFGGSSQNPTELTTNPEKKCLRCRREFTPKHRTNFICDPCKQCINREAGIYEAFNRQRTY